MKSIIQGKIISDYKLNRSIVFIDMSIYNTQLPIDEHSLNINTPYAINTISIFYIPNNITNITSVELQLSNNIESLPCGLYKIKQSICPHNKLFYEFWYVHLDSIKQDIARLYCENKTEEAFNLSVKVDTLEALTYCRGEDSERRILAILDTLNCSKSVCTSSPMKKIINLNNCKTC